jgi:RNA polymerase sigma-70 factor (ECF subfamily)
LSNDADAALATALLAGDPRAAEQAWRRLSPMVLRVVRRHAGAGADAHDLCQEVFLRFLARITELRDRRALRSFLIGICVGVAQNERRRGRVRRAVVLAPGGEPPDVPAMPADVAARRALGRLCAILAVADPEERMMFVLRHIENLDLSAMAAASGRTIPSVKRRSARATRRLGLKMQRDPALADYAAGFTRRQRTTLSVILAGVGNGTGQGTVSAGKAR